MKIITWNCNRQFRIKFTEIVEEDADIYVIQECENPLKSKNEDYLKFAGNNYFWMGKNKNMGLGIFAKSDVKLEKIPNLNEEFENFIALRVNDSFNLLGVWAMKPYVEMIHDYYEANPDLFDENLVMCGDFNSNTIWDGEHKTKDGNGMDKNQTNLNSKLEKSGLVSAYHYLNAEKQGEEVDNTFFLYRHLNKKYYIDYVYSGVGIVCKFEILDSAKWIGLSDHLPISFEVDFNQSKLI